MLLFDSRLDPATNQVHLSVDAKAREALGRVEIIANGNVVKEFSVPAGATSFQDEHILNTSGYTWVAGRCFTRSKDTVQMAHSSPIYVPGAWNPRDDAEFFLQWMDELIKGTSADPKGFSSEGERNAILDLYRRAREFYAAKAN